MEYELYHHGILGMKWGIRRYQNKDGTLTAAGRRRYNSKEAADVDRHLSIISETRRNPNSNTHYLETGVISKLHNKKAEDLARISAESSDAIQKIFDNSVPELKSYRRQIEENRRESAELYERCKNKWLEKHGKEFNDYDEAEDFYRNAASYKDKEYVAEYKKLLNDERVLVNKSNALTEKVVNDMLGSIGNESINSPWSSWQRKKAFSKYGVWVPGKRTKRAEIWNIIGPYGGTD